jgi:NDP-sugar pyrophosphorylase family protein
MLVIYIIPAAGKATRFPKEKWGFKPLIRIEGKTLLEYSIRSLDLKMNDFLIVVVLAGEHVKEIALILAELEIPCESEIVVLQNETVGQAATVYKVTSKLKLSNELVIHNCDTALNYDGLPSNIECAGLILLFSSNLPSFSYAEVDNNGWVTRTAEKQVISGFASTGTYYFQTISMYRRYYHKTTFDSVEHFVAPIYNSMISDNLKVQGLIAQNVFPLGTPSDLQSNEDFLSDQWVPKW